MWVVSWMEQGKKYQANFTVCEHRTITRAYLQAVAKVKTTPYGTPLRYALMPRRINPRQPHEEPSEEYLQALRDAHAKALAQMYAELDQFIILLNSKEATQ